jgi:hypothetical protein
MKMVTVSAGPLAPLCIEEGPVVCGIHE